MKKQLLSLLSVAALAACSGNANKGAEGENEAAPQPAAQSAETVECAVKIWNDDETLKDAQESMDTTYLPNQVAYYDIDGDGTMELLLREYGKEYEMTGFIAVFSLKDGVKKIGMSNMSWQTTFLRIYKTGVVETSRGSESGMDGRSYYFKLKDSDVESVYIEHTWEDEETGETHEEYSVSTPGSEAKALTADEFKTALGDCVGENSYEVEVSINDLKWEDIK